MLPQIQHRQKRKRVVVLGLVGIVRDLDRATEQRLRQDQVRKPRNVKKLVVSVEELFEQLLDAVEVDFLRVEPLEGNVEGIFLFQSCAVRYESHADSIGEAFACSSYAAGDVME